jgi:hypothetical protein
MRWTLPGKSVFSQLVRSCVCLIMILPCFHPFSAHAATYFVDASASDDAGDGSPAHPKKFITSAVRKLQSGDTLIIKDGLYAGQNNMIGDFASPRVWPPSGSAGFPTTIRAEHVGAAIIDAGYRCVGFSSVHKSGADTDYLHIDGLHFRHGSAGVFNIKGTRNKITNCGFEDGMPPDSKEQLPIAYVAGGSSYTLVEDCWVWGRGRYGLYTSSTSGGTHHVVFRRVVVRLDDSPPWMTAGLRFYNAHDNVMQNCVVIDSRIDAKAGEPSAFAQGGGSSYGDPNNTWTGVLAINNPQMWGYNANDVLQTETVTNSVFWGNHDGLFMTPQDTVDGKSAVNMTHLTIGSNAVFGVRHNVNYAYQVNLSNTILQIPDGVVALKEITTVANTFVYAPGTGVVGGKRAGYTPIDEATYAAGLKYLPKVEPRSALGRVDAGASILYRIGESGTCYGDPGWDSSTQIPLWPFPHEALWGAKMRAYTASGPGGNRGFAALGGGTPLTDYVWGYLGHSVPPFNLVAVAGEKKVDLRWNGSKAAGELVGYKVYAGTAPGRYDLPGYTDGKPVGKRTAAVISDLQGGRTYYFAVTAVDKNKGDSCLSYEVQAVVGH